MEKEKTAGRGGGGGSGRRNRPESRDTAVVSLAAAAGLVVNPLGEEAVREEDGEKRRGVADQEEGKGKLALSLSRPSVPICWL